MSDVPELDRLIDEHELAKRNADWDRHDAFCRRLTGYMMLVVLVMLPAALVFGLYGIYFCALVFVSVVVAFLGYALVDLLKDMFTPAPPRDPTRRYKHM